MNIINMSRVLVFMIPVFLLSEAMIGENNVKPTLYIIGDSTVKNGSGRGDGGLWGWGDFMHLQLNTPDISIIIKETEDTDDL